MGKHKKHTGKKHHKGDKKGNGPGRQIITTQAPKPQPSTSAQSLASRNASNVSTELARQIPSTSVQSLESRNAFFTWVHRLDVQVYALELDVFKNSSRAFWGNAQKIAQSLKDVERYQSTVKNLYEQAGRNEIDLKNYSTEFANIGRSLVRIQKRLQEKPEGVNWAPHLQWVFWLGQFISALFNSPLVIVFGSAQLLLPKEIRVPPPLLLPEYALSLQETDEIAASRFEGVEQNQSMRSNLIDRVLHWIEENL